VSHGYREVKFHFLDFIALRKKDFILNLKKELLKKEL